VTEASDDALHEDVGTPHEMSAREGEDVTDGRQKRLEGNGSRTM